MGVGVDAAAALVRRGPIIISDDGILQNLFSTIFIKQKVLYKAKFHNEYNTTISQDEYLYG